MSPHFRLTPDGRPSLAGSARPKRAHERTHPVQQTALLFCQFVGAAHSHRGAAAMPSSDKCARNALINWAGFGSADRAFHTPSTRRAGAELQAARVFALSGTRRSLESAACALDAPAS